MAAYLSIKPLENKANIVKKKGKGINQKKNSNHKHEHKLIGAKHVKGGRGDFRVINLNLNSYLVSHLLLGGGGHRATPPR